MDKLPKKEIYLLDKSARLGATNVLAAFSFSFIPYHDAWIMFLF
uniref:Uncharacterized protein n=1 Tax=Arundo donax TaxID=35708 RepID=A0A0A9FXD3_ARUDO